MQRDFFESLRSNYVSLVLLSVLAFLGFREIENLKTLAHFFMLFAACFFISRKYSTYFNVFSPFLLVSLVFFLTAGSDWLFIGLSSGEWVRYNHFLGHVVNPVFAATLITYALVLFYIFHINIKINLNNELVKFVSFVLFLSSALFVCLIFNSRSTVIGLFFVAIAIMVSNRYIKFGFTALIVVMMTSYYVGIINLLSDRGNSYRFAIWKDAYQRVMSDECSVWFGCGPVAGYRFLGEFYNTHSSYIDIFYRSGVIGSVIFCIFIVHFFYRCVKYKSKWSILSLIGFGTAVTGGAKIFTSPQPFWIYLWMPVFLAMIENTENMKTSENKVLPEK